MPGAHQHAQRTLANRPHPCAGDGKSPDHDVSVDGSQHEAVLTLRQQPHPSLTARM